MKSNRRWFFAGAGIILFLSPSIALSQGTDERAAPEVQPQVGYLAPDFILPSLDGKTVRLSDFRRKNGVFINFWATWCPPCRLEMPTMEKAYQEYQSRGLEILAVSIDVGPKGVVRNFMEEFRLTFPALLDPEREVMLLYRLFSIPASFLIDKHGIIRFKELGYRDWTDPESRKKLEVILK